MIVGAGNGHQVLVMIVEYWLRVGRGNDNLVVLLVD